MGAPSIRWRPGCHPGPRALPRPTQSSMLSSEDLCRIVLQCSIFDGFNPSSENILSHDDETVLDRVAALESRAKDLLGGALQFASRPFVVEFAGAPKSGKSTLVEAVRHFFSRQGYRVHVLTERASICPIPIKGHLFFNTWCFTSMLSELLENSETDSDILIVDRGLFDSLIWLKLQQNRGELTESEFNHFENFILLDRWKKLFDACIVLNVSSSEALRREQEKHISRSVGSVMNEDFLNTLNAAVLQTVQHYRDGFPNIIDIDNTGNSFSESGIVLLEKLLSSLEQFLNPEILVVPENKVQTLESNNKQRFGAKAVNEVLECIVKYGTYIRREEVEKDSNYVQIIPCAILTNENQIFLFQRKERDPKYRLYGKTSIWQGCHVPKQENQDFQSLLNDVLMEKVSSSLFLSHVFPTEALGYYRDHSGAESARHLGIFYRLRIVRSETIADLKKKEFKHGRGYGLSGQFWPSENISKQRDNLGLENWSCAIVDNVRFNIGAG